MASGILRTPRIINVQPTKKHTASLFIFHGSGSTGKDIKEWIDILTRDEFKFPHIKIIYPTAPAQPYTPLGGMLSNVWFDRNGVNIKAPENNESIDAIAKATSELINDEIKNGIPESRIVVSGFSMGGALAMYLAYNYRPSLAGCVAMSSFLNENSLVYEALKNNIKTPPLLQFHGLNDSLVPFSWGEKTHDNLKKLNVNSKLISIPNIEHEIVKSEIEQFKEWILKIIPDV
ncbi:lysophospholipase-like protein 1 [Microplitis demolitor]|uniref:lysophospholipase-like protein 1 n=1 Tax=Microplitis demolitor TaxID=69319 RepID=UPI0004CD5563|nr:lysophospholipase-like protein 1 [Microplitis demolitor]